MSGRFTEEELALAKSVDLTAVAASLGYTVQRIGKYHTLKEMDSIRIYDRTHWFRWSRQADTGNNGGSQIDFLRVFCGMDVKEAVWWLLDFAGYRRAGDPSEKENSGKDYSEKAGIRPQGRRLVQRTSSEQEKTRGQQPLELPPPAAGCSYLYRYLTQERMLSSEVVDYFLKAGLIYESRPYHNIVFKGNDKDGNTKFASMRGVFDSDGRKFKCDVRGSDKRYGFNIPDDGSTELAVFEAAIDLMSYVDIFGEYAGSKLALGMLGDAPLETFLEEHPQVESIRFCLDRDDPGRLAAEKYVQKYAERGCRTEYLPPPTGYKDYNEWLVAAKREKITELPERMRQVR